MTYEEQVAHIAKSTRLTGPELIEAGADLDTRVVLPGEADWESLDVPDDTEPGE